MSNYLEISTIKKDIGLEDKLLARDGTVEEKKNVIYKSNSNVANALEIFHQKLEWDKDGPRKADLKFNEKYLTPSPLSKEEIQSLIACSIRYEDHDKFSSLIGGFVSFHIQSSYNNGSNNFDLDFSILDKEDPRRRINYLGSYLQGKRKNKLKLNIKGNFANYIVMQSSHVEATIDGDVGHSAFQKSRNSRLIVNGNAHSLVGNHLENCEVLINGSVYGRSGEESWRSTFMYGSDVDGRCGKGSALCKYVFSDYDSMLKQNIPMFNSVYTVENKESIRRFPRFLQLKDWVNK